MTIYIDLIPILSIAAGIGVLVAPQAHRYIIAGYLIAIGVIGLLGL